MPYGGKMNISRVMIAAPKSGSGKTLVACALLQALKIGDGRLRPINVVPII